MTKDINIGKVHWVFFISAHVTINVKIQRAREL